MKIITFMILLINLLFANMGQLKVSYDPDYAPYTYNVDGKPYGLFVDIYKKWAKVNHYKVEFIDADTWDNAIKLAKDGKVDFFIGTDPYEDWMKSSKPYYETKTALFALNSEIESFKNIGIIGEDLKEDILKKFPNVNIISYDTYTQLLNGLLDKKLDAIYDDSIALNDFILKHNKSHLIKKLNIISNSSVISAISNDQKKADLFTKGFSKINKDELIALENNWIFNENQKYFNKNQNLEDIFTADEKQWMKENPIVKFAVMSYWPHDDNGESFHTAMLKLINEYIGTNFIPVKYDSWSDGFNMASSGVEVQGIMGLSYSKERENKYFYYTPAYYFSPSYIVVKDTNNDIKELSDLENKTIYLKSKSISHKIISSNLKNTKVIDLSTIDEMYKNLSTSKKVDAFVSYFADEKMLQKYNLKIAKTMYEKYGEASIGVNHNYPQLASIIKKAYTLIPKRKIASLRDKRWGKKIVPNTKLSKKQISYLSNKKVLKICTNPNLAPIEFIQDGKIKGITIDILTYLQDTLNLKYEYIKTNSWSQSQQFLKDKRCDILSSAIKTKKRAKYAKFTKPYLSYDLAIVTKDDKPLSQNIDDFLDKTMSRAKGSGLISKIKTKYPTITVIETKDTKESFDKVIRGDVDFTIATLPVLQYYKSKYGLKGLQVVGYIPMKYNLRIAVRDDQQILTDILDLSLSGLSAQTYKIIHDKWKNVKVMHQTHWKLIIEIVLIVLAIFIFILWNNKKLKLMIDAKTADINEQKNELKKLSENLEIKVQERTKELNDERQYINSVMNSQSSIVITTNGQNLESVNKAFLDFFNVKDVQEFQNIYGNCICDTFDVEAPKEFIQKTIDGVQWVDYIKQNPNLTHKVIIDKNEKKHIFSINADSFVFNDIVLNTVVFNDITEFEKIREDIELSKKSTEMILANILFPVLITARKRRVVVYANKFAQDLYEVPQNEIIDKELDSVYTLTNGPQEVIRQITEYGRVDGLEEHVTTHTGKEFIGLLSVNPIVYNNEECYIGMTVDITKQKDMENKVRAIHKHTRESIEYASLIQGAVVSQSQDMEPFFKDHFVIWTPKDTVGGDIWLFNELRHKDECLLFFIDCTGHGVPGAFVTMIVKAIEREIVANLKKHPEFDISPAIIMSHFNKTMKVLLKQKDKTSVSNAGWDGGIIYYNRRTKILKFAGAETPLFYVDENKEFKTVKGNRYSVGYKKCAMDYQYKETIIKVQEGMKFYCTTDGYLDQNGGEKDFPFGKKRFGNIIKEHYIKPMANQQEIFINEMDKYESMIEDNDRNDDMTVIGFEI